MRRKNTVKKRLKARGEGVDHLPLIGTQTRTYAAGHCLHATIQRYNFDDNTCVIQPQNSQLTLTTTIAKASRSAVRKNDLTADETNTVNHVIERLTDTTLTHAEEWKPYGTIARVTNVCGEPHVTIVRTDDAQVEQQPLVDVVDADMMRLGKYIAGTHLTRGRAKNRDRRRLTKNRRGAAPSRNPNKNAGGLPPGTTGRGGDPPRTLLTANSDGRRKPRGAQGPRQRVNTPSGPENRGAIMGRDQAHPEKANRGLSSRQHRRPAQRIAAGHPAGDAAGPND